LDKQSGGPFGKFTPIIEQARRGERLFFRIQRLAQAPLQISGIPRIASINLGDRRSPGEAAHELLERRYFGKSFPARF